MTKHDYRQKFDQVLCDPHFRSRLTARLKPVRRRLSPALIAAILALMLLATGALAASGLWPQIFRSIPYSRWHTDTLNDHSAAGLQAQTFVFSNGVTVTAALEQAYYNGEQLALGWTLVHDSTAVQYMNRDTFSPADRQSRAFSLYNWIDAAEFERRYAETGFACATRLTYCTIEGPTLANSQTSVAWEDAGVDYLYQSAHKSPLHDVFRNQDSLTVTANVRGTVQYFYRDATGMYSGTLPEEAFAITASVPRTDTFTARVLQQHAVFPRHTADIMLTITPLNCLLTIQNTAASEPVLGYELLIDGHRTSTGSIHNASDTQIDFALPPDAQSITLRPVYADSGTLDDADFSIPLH